ncbi:MAG: ribonuclease [Pseudomonadota bacterium]|nr:ribonuclease [Pseudomonadota bacterium]
MPEWWIERGIGETRAVLVEADEILETRIHLEASVAAGAVLKARLRKAGLPAFAEAEACEYLLPKGAPGVAEGAALAIEVTREAIPGAEPWKRPLARVADGPERAGDLPAGRKLAFPAPVDELEAAGWSDLLEEARSGIVRFAGGELRVSPTPAMTLIDVNGHLPLAELAMAGAKASARAIRRHGIGGSIGIDLPTIAGKAQRQSIGEAIDALLPQPFERTAMNGFGFLQIVRPRRHASLFELGQDRPAFEARALLRRAGRERGAIRLVAHPRIAALLESRGEWRSDLARQVGGSIGLRAEPAAPMSGGYAEPA